MRLLTIAPTGFFANYGCHVRILGQLMALQRSGYKIRLVTYPSGQTIHTISTTRVPLPFARSLSVGSSHRKILLDALLAPTALAVALRLRPTVIHSYLHEGALIGAALAALLRVPLTFDYQGSLTAEMADHKFIAQQSRFLPALQQFEQKIDRQPDILFLSSEHAVSRLASHVPATKLQSLPDSVDPNLFRPQPADPALLTEYDLDPSRKTIVYLGLLAPYQGIDLLLQAIAQPILKKRSVQFLIMGFPHVDQYQRMAAELDIADFVRFTGPVIYTQAARHLALGDLAIALKLSKTEGSGKLLPYMSMALPIVATDSPVHRQYLENNGVFVPHPTPQSVAETLCWALDNLPTLRQKGYQLRQRVKENFTWDHAAQTMAMSFHSLVS